MYQDFGECSQCSQVELLQNGLVAKPETPRNCRAKGEYCRRALAQVVEVHVTPKCMIDIIDGYPYPMAMSRIAFTLRMDTEEHAALASLSEVEGRPMNQLLNEAIKSYLSREGGKERRLEASLARLKAYRKRDPGFREAIAAFVEAEATFEDPVEGRVTEEARDPAGPVQSKLRELMGA